MNREIKFRGVRIDTGEMIYGSLCKGIQEGTMCIMPNTFFGTVIFTDEEETKFNRQEDGLALGGWFGIKPETVGHIIGIQDKNGTQVFDGDIMQCYSWGKDNEKLHIDVIEWSIDEMGWDFRTGFVEDRYDFRRAVRYAEVIGNIHQNVELLTIKE